MTPSFLDVIVASKKMIKILLVGGAREVLGQEKSLLNRANIKALTARTGKEAIGIYRKELPDVVVLEYALSDMSGLDLLREIFILKRCQILMVIEKGDDEAFKACKDAGVDEFTFKPIKPKELLKKVGNLLNIPKREDFRILMKIKLEGDKEGDFFMGSTIDISTSGVLIETHHGEIDVGDHLECNFFLPWKLKAVKIEGEVTRKGKIEGKEGFHYGIHFLRLDPILKKEIADYIKKKERISDYESGSSNK